MKENFDTALLDEKSQFVLNEFIEACLTLNIKRIEDLFNKNPEYIKPDDKEETPFLIRVDEIFNEFKADSPVIKVYERNCTGCTPGGKTKMFNVTYKDAPEKNSNFGFLIQIEGNSITEIYECSQYKSYQNKLQKRVFAGMTEAQIIEFKNVSKNLPDL